MNDKKKTPVITCGIALIRRGRQFLISQRNENDTFGSFWEFPGGKKNSNESFEQCVARETLEEIGVEITVGEKFMDIKKSYHDRMIWLNFYLCDYVSGEPKPIDCQKVLWTDVMELKNFGFPPANEVVIRKLMQNFA